MYLFSKRNKNIINGILINKIFANAYIFYGVAGSFVNQAGEFFKKGLFCENFQDEPCEKCASCLALNNNNMVDVYEVWPEKSSISIENVRNIQNYIKYGPIERDKMLVIIYEADKLNAHSGNALLKTLEEPPANVIFLLLTDNLNQLLPTILSRSQIIDFSVVFNQIVLDYLQTLDNSEREKIEEICFGNIELIKYYLDQKLIIDPQIYKSYSDFTRSNIKEKFEYVNKLIEFKDKIKLVLLLWVKEILNGGKTLDAKAIAMAELIIENISYLKYNLNLRLHLENLFLKLS